MPKRRTDQRHRHPRRDDDLRRRPPTKRGRAIILIVCEGLETEYRYFEALRKRKGLISVSIEVARSGRQSERLVEQAVDLRRKRSQEPDALPYEEVWCVFDREAAHEPADFSAAIIRADREQLALAVSNPCFEYWYLWCSSYSLRPIIGRCVNTLNAASLTSRRDAASGIDALPTKRKATHDEDNLY